MAETYTGQVQNGVVVFDAGVSPPSEGTRVRVEAERPLVIPRPIPDEPMTSTRAWLLATARKAEADPEARLLPDDLAERHDHYAHGKPSLMNPVFAARPTDTAEALGGPHDLKIVRHHPTPRPPSPRSRPALRGAHHRCTPRRST